MWKIIFVVVLVFVANGANAHEPSAIEVPDTIAERVRACTLCHGDEDKLGRDAYYPRIAGKPRGYLYNQLRNFRDGRRNYQPMEILLENMSDAYLLEIADYFSSLQLPFPAPERFELQAEEISLVENLIYYGYPEQAIPACSACHGDNLMGIKPFIPGLLGLSRAYIAAQFGGWRSGLIRGRETDCMSEIANQLTSDEINALAKWLAIQPVSGKPGPADDLAHELSHRCTSLITEVEP